MNEQIPVAEQEVIIEIRAEEPGIAWVYSSWPSWSACLERTEGFLASVRRECLVDGAMPRRSLEIGREISCPWALDLFQAEKEALPEEEVRDGLPPLDAERSITLTISAASPYWARIDTDCPKMLAELEDNPFAVRRSKRPEGQKRSEGWFLPSVLVSLSSH